MFADEALAMRSRGVLWATVAATRSFFFANAGPLWVDLDNSAGLAGVQNPDSALALLQLLNSPEVEVVGISTTFGNAGSEEIYAATKVILERFYPEYLPKLFKGASGPGDFSKSPATDALGVAMRKHKSTKFKEQLEFLALGSLTNLAALLSQDEHRTFAEDAIWRVVFAGGRKKGQLLTVGDQSDALPDLNFEKDVAAAKEVLNSAVMLTMVGWEVSSKLPVDRLDLETLASSGSASAKWAAEVSEPWLRFWGDEFKVNYFNPSGCLAVLHVAQPEFVRCENQLGWIEDGPSDTVTTTFPGVLEGNLGTRGLGAATKSYFHAGSITYTSGTQIIFCHTPAEGAKDMILHRISAETQHRPKPQEEL